MTTLLTREQAAAAITAASTERDTIQSNLLDLDNSFGKRLLAGAKLTGQTKTRWDTVSADLTTLWETFSAYSAVVDRAAEVLAGARRAPAPKLAEISSLLYGTSVRLSRPSSALARGDLTSSGEVQVSLAAAVADMRRAFAAASAVVTAAEAVWNEAADPLQQISEQLAATRRQATGFADDALNQALTVAETECAQLRDVLNTDPLALWQQGGHVDTTRIGKLRERATAAAARASELRALREDASRRIAAVAAAVSAAASARTDAIAARDRAAAKIAGGALPTPPDVAGLTARLADLDALKAAGRWPRLASELDLVEKQAAAAAGQCRDAEQAATALLDRREELRGLLDAYQARAMKLGGAEDSGLDAAYARARDLLWTAPCDLTAATAAVTGYQQAVLALSRRGAGT
jgi:hypothetical protein